MKTRTKKEILNYLVDMGFTRFSLEYDLDNNVVSCEFKTAYAVGLLLCTGEELKETDKEYFYSDDRYFNLMVEIFHESGILIVNEILHYLHLLFGDEIRQGAMGRVTRFKKNKYGEELRIEYVIWDLEVFIGDFPEDLKEEIESHLGNFIRDDYSINFYTTWLYSHIDEGVDYVYKDNEHPEITINCFNKKVKEVITKKIEKFLKSKNFEYGKTEGPFV